MPNENIKEEWILSLNNYAEIGYIYCSDLRGSCSWESIRSPFDDEKFISRRNFSVKQALSAEVIYNYAIHTQRSTADSKESPTQRYYHS